MKKTLLTALVPALLLACENPVVQDILRDSAAATGIHINAEILDGPVYKPAGDINYGLSPAFTPERTNYTALVPENTDRVTVTAVPYKNGTVRYREEGGPDSDLGIFDFTGKNSAVIYVTVNREYMDPTVYTVLVKRKQPAWLNGITVTSDATGDVPQPLHPGFDPDTPGYTVIVPSTAASVNVTGSVQPGVEISFKQNDGAFGSVTTAADTNTNIPSGDLPFNGAEEITVTIKVFLPPSGTDSYPSPIEYTLLIQRPGTVKAAAGQENNFLLGDSAAEHHYYREGEVVAFTVRPPFGYTTAAVYYTPEGGEPVTLTGTGGVYAFVMPHGDVSLRGEWAAVPPVPGVLYVRGLRDGETKEQILAEKEGGGNGSDGSSWADASLDLQYVMDHNPENREIWISAGKVKPDWSGVITETSRPDWANAITEAQLADKRNHAFVLKKGAHIYGGFEGIETAKPPALPQNKTILSGDMGTEGNARHVLIAADIDGDTVVENLTISGGSGAGSGADITVTVQEQEKKVTGNSGGGVYTFGCTRELKFINVTISGNTASDGGGMYNDGSGPTLEGVTISGNTATGNGGGMYNNTGSSPRLVNTSVSGNSAFQGGGGMYNDGAKPVLEWVKVNNNESSGTDAIGGIFNKASTVFTGTNVEISGNRSIGGGTGGIDNTSSNFTGTHITISGNSSGTGTGGMKNKGSHVSLTNARVTGNATGAAGMAPNSDVAGGICNLYGGNGNLNNFYVSLTNVEISGNSSNGIAGGMFTRLVHVTLTNVTVSGNSAAETGGWGIYHNHNSSSTKKFMLQNSIIWGNGTDSQKNIVFNTTPNSNIFANTLVERPGSSGGSGIVTGAYNATVSEPFSGSAADIFAGPLPLSEAPVSAPPGAYQLKSPGIWIDAVDNTLYQEAVYDLSDVSPGSLTLTSAPPLISGPTTDFAGAIRPLGVIDLGAYERQ